VTAHPAAPHKQLRLPLALKFPRRRAYFGFGEVPSPLVDLEKWIRRRLRYYAWKQWGRRSDRGIVPSWCIV